MNEIVVLVTAATEDEAQRISKALVEQGAVACVNILPGIRSVFRWKGKIAEDQEVLLMAKTVVSAFDRVASIVRANHSYEVPEVISLPIQHGTPEYLSWVRALTQDVATGGG